MSILKKLANCACLVLALSVEAASATSSAPTPLTRSGEGAQSLYMTVDVARDGSSTRSAFVGVPQTVDQQVSINWANQKADAATLALLPSLPLNHLVNINTAALAAAENSLHNERASLYPAFAETLTSFMAARGIQSAVVAIRQRVLHQGREKIARSMLYAFSSGYYDSTRVQIRATDRPLTVLHAEYRARRDLGSRWEHDEIPPSMDPNETSGRLGLWVTLRRADTWAELSPAQQINVRTASSPTGNFISFSNRHRSFGVESTTTPGTLVEDILWPGRCLMDRTSANTVTPSLTCPNTVDVKSLAANYDADIVVLDYHRTTDWRMLPVSGNTMRKDYHVNVTRRVARTSCFAVNAGAIFYEQTAVLTGTMRVTTDRFHLRSDGTVAILQQFNKDVSLNYPYSASVKLGGNPQFFDGCGSLVRQVDDDLLSGGYVALRTNFGSGCEAPWAAYIPLAEMVVVPAYSWWVGSDKGAMNTQLAPVERTRMQTAIGSVATPGFPATHFTLAPIGSETPICSTPTCPNGQTLVNGVCTPNTAGCPPNSYFNQATGQCITCPHRGQILNVGSLTCFCPECQTLGPDTDGVTACVKNPLDARPMCQTTGNSCAAIAAAVGYDRMQTLPGSTPSNPLYATGCPTCAEGWKWNSVLGECRQEIRDRCTNIPGVQQFVPNGMVEQNGICQSLPAERFCTCGNATVELRPGTMQMLETWDQLGGSIASFTGQMEVRCVQQNQIDNMGASAIYTFASGAITRRREIARTGVLEQLCYN